jgi:iron complex transport system substrate-binding protein
VRCTGASAGRAGRAALTGAVLAAAWACGALAGAAPQRIASLNVCTDQLLMLLVERHRIASVSHLATDPHTSAMAAEARGLAVNHGLAEEVLPLDPDLVLAGVYTARHAVSLLRRLGHRVVEVPIALDVEGIRANVRSVARALGAERRAEALIARFDAGWAALGRAGRGPAPRAVLYGANGFTAGSGTLEHAVLTHVGLRNLAAEIGVRGVAQLPLERLLVARPQVLVTGRAEEGASLAAERGRHPALRRALEQARGGGAVVRIPGALWTCGTPAILAAAELLAAASAAAAVAPGAEVP